MSPLRMTLSPGLALADETCAGRRSTPIPAVVIKILSALPRLTLDLVGPEAITGASAAQAWASALGSEVAYAGDDVAAFESQMAQHSPSWLAYDMRLMLAGIQTIGMRGEEGAVERLQAMLGRPLRHYAAFVQEAVAAARSAT